MTRATRLFLVSLILGVVAIGSLSAVIYLVGSSDRRRLAAETEGEWARRKDLAQKYLQTSDPRRQALVPVMERAHAALRRRLVPRGTFAYPPPAGTYLQMLFWLMMSHLTPEQYDPELGWVQKALRDAELTDPPNLLDRNLKVLERELEEAGVFDRLPAPPPLPPSTAETSPASGPATDTAGGDEQDCCGDSNDSGDARGGAEPDGIQLQ